MDENTINVDVTMDGAAATLLAGRYRAVRQLGQGGMGSDFAKCERDEYAALGIPLMTEIHSCCRNYTALFEARQKLLDSLTEKHPDIIALGPRIDRTKKNLTETIAQSAGLVEKYANRYDCELQEAVVALKDDVLANWGV